MAYNIAMQIFRNSWDLLDGFINFEQAAENDQRSWTVAMDNGLVKEVQEILARFAKNDFSK